MKYIKVPHSGQYNVYFETYVMIDKITCVTDYYIYILGENHAVPTDWTADEILNEIRKVEENG